MGDVFDETGLTVKILSEIITDLTTGMQGIYGADINVDQNSPDGQLINLIAQASVDLRELAVQINAGFDPDQAVGTILDQRAAINNISRSGGTFTIVSIDVTTDRTVILQGLDADYNDANGTGYTIQDDAGTKFILIDTATLTAGTTAKDFRAQQVGLVETIVDTITTPVTVILGVTTVNNPSAPSTTGVNEETDTQLRIRRQQSTENGNSGYLNGLLGEILNLDGATSAKLYENVTDITDADGIPPHAMWLIVEGGATADIAEVIYAKKSYGCDMYGATTHPITTASGATFTAEFDRPTPEDLHIRFDIQKTSLDWSLDTDLIKQYIEDNLIFEVGEFAETSRVTAVALAAIEATGKDAVPINMEISSDGATWYDYLTVATLDNQWAVSIARITPTVL
ncbi:MAG: hypothetical protein KAJ40_09075 [Alphaproteobacteria bacterium]|nr:hypothetical protein [Alphaproteobacteria bacterium]